MNENINEIEIALRDGLIDELTTATEKSTMLIERLIKTIKDYEKLINRWEAQNDDLIVALVRTTGERDRARETAVRLEQECHSCNDTVHHGNEEVYDGTI